MGCYGSRKALSEEEIALRTEELKLNYHLNSVRKHQSVFSIYSREGKVNTKGLSEAAVDLNLQLTDQESYSKIEEFYAKLLVEEDKYPTRSLIMLGAMLGLGTRKERAKILFELYDDKFEGSLTRGEVKELLDEMVLLSTSSLGTLVGNNQNNGSGDLRNKDYIRGLRAVSSNFLATAMRQLLGDRDSISKEEFQEAFSLDTLDILLPSSLRVTLSEFKKAQALRSPSRSALPQ